MAFIKKENLQIIFKYLFAFIFLFSVYTKLISYEDFNSFLENLFQIPWRLALIVANILLAIEFFLGVSFVIEKNIDSLIGVSLFLLIVFTIFNALLFIFDLSSECYCFGNFWSMSPIESIIKNCIMICGLFYLKKTNFSFLRVKQFFVLVIIILIFNFSLTTPANLFSYAIPEISYSKIRDRKSILLIDARDKKAYALRHIQYTI